MKHNCKRNYCHANNWADKSLEGSTRKGMEGQPERLLQAQTLEKGGGRASGPRGETRGSG